MEKGTHALKSCYSNAALVIVLIVYTVLILNFFHYERLTGDTTLYLSIAEKYIRGDFSNAVNGYWGPLLSWLLIPFLFFGATHLLAINALNLIFGLLTALGIWRLSLRFEISENIRALILISLIPILLFFSLIQPMDFLLLCVLVYYLNIVFNKEYPSRMSHALTAGLLGSLAYFSKPYGFPFFISHFILINACHYIRNTSIYDKRRVLRNFLIGIVIFSVLSGIWITLISKKYDQFTFSMMGKGVFSVYKPGTSHQTLEKGDPIFYKGFFEPPNDTAFIIYEDPTYARGKAWNPLESSSSLKRYIHIISANVFECMRLYESYSRLSAAIIIVYILLLFAQPFKTLITRGDILYPLLTIVLYTGGYLPFHFESRYLWIINILLLLMGGQVLTILFRSKFFDSRSRRTVLMCLFLLSFTVTPIKASINIGKHNINSEMHDLGRELHNRYGIRGNIASNREMETIASHNAWHKTFRLAYWLKSRYYGQAEENISDTELENDLIKNNIDYYFFWGEPGRTPQFLFQYHELTNGGIPGLRIYSLKDKSSR